VTDRAPRLLALVLSLDRAYCRVGGWWWERKAARKCGVETAILAY